ncbi:MAG: hypothetical protein ABR985_00620 [Methanotrichaceae archaeon]|jgi:hypothetical protein
MKLTRKLQMREDAWATIAVPTIVLRSPVWDGVSTVSIQFDSDNPDLLIVRPATSVTGENQE